MKCRISLFIGSILLVLQCDAFVKTYRGISRKMVVQESMGIPKSSGVQLWGVPEEEVVLPTTSTFDYASTDVQVGDALAARPMLRQTRQAVLGTGLATLAGLALLSCASPALASTLADDIIEKANSSGFVQAFLLIFVSEIGDKTFFIAGLLAAKYSRAVSFIGSMGALAVMTVISTAIGQIFHKIPAGIAQGIPFDDYVAVAAFTYFGGKTLYEASQLDDGDSSGIEEEKAEAEQVVEEVTADQTRRSALAAIVQTFSLVFAAEVGDRSFLSTIALSAALNPAAVASGALTAHAAATGIAVIGGAVMSQYLSEKTIGYIGGSLFLIFAFTTAMGIF